MNRIDEIKARLESITPGTWHLAKKGVRSNLAIYVESPDDENADLILMRPGHSHRQLDREKRANMEFAVNAPADIAFLMAEIERLEGITEKER